MAQPGRTMVEAEDTIKHLTGALLLIAGAAPIPAVTRQGVITGVLCCWCRAWTPRDSALVHTISCPVALAQHALDGDAVG